MSLVIPIGNYTHAQLGGCGHSRFSRAIQAAVEVCTASTLPVKRCFHLRRNTPAIQGANSVGKGILPRYCYAIALDGCSNGVNLNNRRILKSFSFESTYSSKFGLHMSIQ